MAIDVKQYAKELMDEAGIPEGDRKTYEALFSNEKASKRLEATLRESTEGVERERGRTSAEKQRADAAVKAQNDYYQEQLKLANSNKAVVDEVNRQLAVYEDTYGKLTGAELREAKQAITADVIDKKTFDERISRTEGLTISLVKDAALITARHLKTFNEEPDFDAIEKIAVEKGLTARKAYDEWVAPRLEAKRTEEQSAATKAAIDAALIEDRSKRGATQIADAAPKSEFMTNMAKQQKPSTAEESFIKGWREPEPAKVSKQEFGRT